MELTNSDIAELLAIEAETAKHHVQRAFRRASRAALLWPEEAADVLNREESLASLPAIGPFLEKFLRRWLEDPPHVPERPPLRKQFLSYTEAQRILAARPGWSRKLRGDLQMHTEWSDGSATVRQMAEAAIERGYQYVAITDHAKKLKIAGGINEEQLTEQATEIAEFNDATRQFKILRSIELNLDLQGAGDLDAKSLNELDIVLGAFHSSLRKSEDQTERYLAALKNPSVHILGHPRGRIYNFRLGLMADWPRVFSLAAELGKAVEIDCYPDRQDLNLDLVKIAAQAGTHLSLGTDAHHCWQLQFIDFGLASALAANFPKERVLNFMSVDQLKNWVTSIKR
ncbi:MAG TPA: PHP domain-containing protein [Verrucomicrobiae bacterium]|nr:PHP domain-containing protein [Verrucomicrobiae bacterium]